MIQARQDATYLGNGVPGLPHEVGPYHSLLPLDHRVGISKIYGYPTPLYRAVSSIDGGVYCLRRIEGESPALQARPVGRGLYSRSGQQDILSNANVQDTRYRARNHSPQWRNGDR
jgi:hypothetical protein